MRSKASWSSTQLAPANKQRKRLPTTVKLVRTLDITFSCRRPSHSSKSCNTWEVMSTQNKYLPGPVVLSEFHQVSDRFLGPILLSMSSDSYRKSDDKIHAVLHELRYYFAGYCLLHLGLPTGCIISIINDSSVTCRWFVAEGIPGSGYRILTFHSRLSVHTNRSVCLSGKC